MPKGKTKKPAQPAKHVSRREFDDAKEFLAIRLTAQANQIAALNEAICPRVAARLTALERAVKAQYCDRPAPAAKAAPQTGSGTATNRAPSVINMRHVETVARRINTLMKGPTWEDQTTDERMFHRELTQKIIRIVLGVVG